MRNHHVVYEILLPGFSDSDHPTREERYYCSGPIIALNEFHRHMQRSREMADDRRTVIRPKLQPGQYTIARFYEKYIDSTGNAVESDFDLPNTTNPDILEETALNAAAKKADKDPANFFGFFDEAKSTKPEDSTLPAQA